MRSRSPCATAAMARVTSVVGHSRSSISELTEDSISPQAPSESPKRTRWRVRPSRPTTWPTRSSWLAMRWLVPTISLKVSAILPMIPTRSPAIRTEKSPIRMACRACSSSGKAVSVAIEGNRMSAPRSVPCSDAGKVAASEEPLAGVMGSSGACMDISGPWVGAGLAVGVVTGCGNVGVAGEFERPKWRKCGYPPRRRPKPPGSNCTHSTLEGS